VGRQKILGWNKINDLEVLEDRTSRITDSTSASVPKSMLDGVASSNIIINLT